MIGIAGWGLIVISCHSGLAGCGFGWNKAKYVTKPLVMVVADLLDGDPRRMAYAVFMVLPGGSGLSRCSGMSG